MKRALRTIARSSVRYARTSRLGDWIRAGETSPQPDMPLREVIDTFTDSRQQKHQLLKGYRDRVKPDWRRMFEPPATSIGENERANAPIAGRRSVDEFRKALIACSVELNEGTLLEVGCYTGTRAFALAAFGGFDVIAIDLPEYYVQQSPNKFLTGDALERETVRLAKLRHLVRNSFLAQGSQKSALERVRFFEEDIGSTSLPSESFDAIVSWEVLEHVREPLNVFRETFRLLKPGGVTFHEYNPFFCAEGGHSLCTLDFPYGHVRLSASDFESYLHRFRPQEAEVALRFFHKNLNRMTLADLRQMCDLVGYDVLATLPWLDASDLAALDETTLDQVRAIYPTATLEDLLARRVWVVLRKPS